IEFAFTLPILVLILVGIFDFGLAFHQYLAVTNAAREGARVAVLPGYNPIPPNSDVEFRVNQYLSASHIQGTAVTNAVPFTITPPSGPPFTVWKVTVTLPYTFQFIRPFLMISGAPWAASYNLQATATMRPETAAGGN